MTSHQMVTRCVAVYFLMTVSSVSSSDCQDSWKICIDRITRDLSLCDRQDYKDGCKKTCGLCGDCQDTWEICFDYITRDLKLCDRQEYKGGCKKTCGLCGGCSDILSDCSKSNCQQNGWKIFCRKTCKACVDQVTGGHVTGETATSTTTTTSATNQLPPEITSHPDMQTFSAGVTVTLTCKSRNTGNTRGALSWESPRQGIWNQTHQHSDGSIQLDIFQLSTKHDGMTVTCVERGAAETQSAITIRVDMCADSRSDCSPHADCRDSAWTAVCRKTCNACDDKDASGDVRHQTTASTTSTTAKTSWGEWGTWSECSATCGDVTRSRRRTCSTTQATCPGEATETITCNNPPCCVPQNGRWSSWNTWLSCSRSCGKGTRARSRTCYERNACGQPCEGNEFEEQYCNEHVCPVWGDWSSWTCSVTCGRGTQSRTRTCTPPSAKCSGSSSETQVCSSPQCCVPRNGRWNSWSIWSPCSLSCGKGTRTRSRTCTGASACGQPCDGNSSTDESCNEYLCPRSPDMASLSIFNHSNYHDFRCLVDTEYAKEFELFKITSNGSQITRNLTSGTNYVDFRLENMQCDDAGIYYCTARKGTKTANSTSVQLNIPCSPRRAPGTSTLLERIEVVEGSRGQYTFAVIAHPVPTIENINYLIEDTVSSLKKEPLRSDFITGDCQQNTPDLHLVTCSLSITDASRNDNGLYSFKIRNPKGIMNVTFELSVIAHDSAQSAPSLSWIVVVVVLLILILIGALVVFFVMRRRAAERKTYEDKKKMPSTATAHRTFDDAVYYNITTVDVNMPSSAATMTSGTCNVHNGSAPVTSPDDNVYVNYEKKTSLKDSGESGAITTSDDSPQDDLYAVVDKTRQSSSSENTGKPPKPAPMPKPKRLGSASCKSADDGVTSQSQNNSSVQEGGDHSHPTNEEAGSSPTQKATGNEEGLFYTELDFSQYRPASRRPLTQKEETNYAAIEFKLQQ